MGLYIGSVVVMGLYTSMVEIGLVILHTFLECNNTRIISSVWLLKGCGFTKVVLRQFLRPLSNVFPLFVVPNHFHPIIQTAVECLRERTLDYCLMKDKPHKWAFQMLIFELSEAFQDSCDAKVIVPGSVEMSESIFPVFSSLYLTWGREGEGREGESEGGRREGGRREGGRD